MDFQIRFEEAENGKQVQGKRLCSSNLQEILKAFGIKFWNKADVQVQCLRLFIILTIII